jgi:hypothetical protein
MPGRLGRLYSDLVTASRAEDVNQGYSRCDMKILLTSSFVQVNINPLSRKKNQRAVLSVFK